MSELLDSRQLKTFLSLADKGSFTLAAREMNLVQSAVSHSIKSLEQDLGCRLFDRLGKKVVLTQPGEQLLQHARRIVKEMEEARTSLDQMGFWGKRRLRIGASTTATQHVLPAVLREFKECFPECMIEIEPGDSPESIEALEENRIDLALALEPKNQPRYSFVKLFSDDLHFIVAPHHPWASKKRVKREDLLDQNYILYNKKSYTFGMVERYFRREQVAMKSAIQYGSMEAIKELVKIGLGIGILAPWMAKKELSEGSLIAIPAGKGRMRRNWGIVHWKDRELSMTEETFIKLCASFTEQFQTSI